MPQSGCRGCGGAAGGGDDGGGVVVVVAVGAAGTAATATPFANAGTSTATHFATASHNLCRCIVSLSCLSLA